MIIGITGTLAAGKGTIVEFLKAKGFEHYSVREYLIEEIKKRGFEINRDSMVFVANDLRANYGSGYIAEQLYEKAKRDGKNCVIESLRTVGEVNELQKKEEFYLFGIDANPFLRYERAKKRKSETDNVSYEEFLKNEKREFENVDPTKGNLKACIELSDFNFSNNGMVEDLEKELERVLDQIEKPKNDSLKVRIKKIHPDSKIPAYAKFGDAGMNLFAVSKRVEEKFIEYGTGLSFEIPEGYVGLIFPRSSVTKKDLVLKNSVGVLDSGYRGELLIRFYSLGEEDYEIGERVAQLMIMPHPKIEFEEVFDLKNSERGIGGFGSSGEF